MNAIVNALAATGMLGIASLRHQFLDIGAYAFGSSVIAIGAVFLSAGSTLTYTAEARNRYAIRKFRYAVTTPALVVLALFTPLIGAKAYASMSILFGALSVVATNATELALVDLQRHARLPALLLTTVVGRLTGLALAVFGTNFSTAMMTASVVSGCLAVPLATASRRSECKDIAGKFRVQTIRDSVNQHIFALSILSIFALRLPFLLATWTIPSREAGVLSTLLSATQYVSSFLVTGLYTVLAQRSRDDLTYQDKTSLRRTERQYVQLAVLLACGLAASAPLVANRLSGGQTTFFCWLLLCASIPLVVRNRALQYNFNAVSNHRRALSLIAVISVTTAAAASLSIFVPYAVVIAFSVPIGESAGNISERLRRES